MSCKHTNKQYVMVKQFFDMTSEYYVECEDCGKIGTKNYVYDVVPRFVVHNVYTVSLTLFMLGNFAV